MVGNMKGWGEWKDRKNKMMGRVKGWEEWMDGKNERIGRMKEVKNERMRRL